MTKSPSASSRLTRFAVVTYYLGDRFHFRKLQERHKEWKYLTHAHPLVIELGKNEYFILTKFGTVTFWNTPPATIERLLREVAPFVEGLRQHNSFTDTLEVWAGAVEERVTFEEVYLKKLDLEKIKIISYVSAQSVALDRYEEEIDGRLKELERVVHHLKTGGETKLPEKALLVQIGNVLAVKQHVVGSLSLFDKPQETWEREEIEELYIRLRSAYELRDRFGILNEKMDFLTENNMTLVNMLSSRRANYLELIVVVLIVVEILIFLFDIFAFRK